MLSVLTYQDDDEAVRIANGTDYGLQAYVLGDPEHARRIATRVRAGRVAVNSLPADSDAPSGGFKQSGVGREFGHYGIDPERRAVSRPRRRGRRPREPRAGRKPAVRRRVRHLPGNP